ncbi:MAG TPA: spore germination protein, partial [Bacillota bacterium]|nr:spore germination protein [Bacillota bacterium]
MSMFGKKNKSPKTDDTEPLLITAELQENPAKSLLLNTAARDTKQALRGSKLRFLEDLQSNLELIRYLAPSPELTTETYRVGSSASKILALVYLKDVANLGIVDEVKDRIKAIKAKTVFDNSYIQRNIEDSGMSPFPQVETTNRPDVTQSALWQGRVAILLEGSPDVLLAPCTFFELLDTPDDAFSRWPFATSFFKVARYIMLLIALCLPGFYIALLSYNPELVPTRLLLLIVSSREGTPFPIYFEAF